MNTTKSVTEQLEQERVRLAGCLTAAEGHNSNPAKPADYGWSPAYQATLDLRKNHDKAMEAIRRLKQRLASEAWNRHFLTCDNPAKPILVSNCPDLGCMATTTILKETEQWGK